MTKKTKIISMAILTGGVIASVARIAYAGFIFLMSVQIFRRIKWAVPLLMVIVITVIAIIDGKGGIDSLDILRFNAAGETPHEETQDIRLYTRMKAIVIYRDSPMIGVGPGMFGGTVAMRYNSSVYEEYNVQRLAYLKRVGNIEQFWFQLLPETGVAGTLSYCGILVVMFYMFSVCRQQAESDELKNVFSFLRVFLICIVIYTAGSGINIAPVFFTYCAFAGMALGCFHKESQPCISA